MEHGCDTYIATFRPECRGPVPGKRVRVTLDGVFLLFSSCRCSSSFHCFPLTIPRDPRQASRRPFTQGPRANPRQALSSLSRPCRIGNRYRSAPPAISDGSACSAGTPPLRTLPLLSPCLVSVGSSVCRGRGIDRTGLPRCRPS